MGRICGTDEYLSWSVKANEWCLMMRVAIVKMMNLHTCGKWDESEED